jgi:hypothetical protein
MTNMPPSYRLRQVIGPGTIPGVSTSPPTPPIEPGPIVAPSRDQDHLRLLSIFYYVFAGLQAIGGCVGLVYTVVGIGMMAGGDAIAAEDQSLEGAPQAIGGLLFGIGLFTLLLSSVLITLEIMAANRLRRQRGRTFCMVIAGLTCLSIPLGTILGIFTFVVLARPSVAALFAAKT